MARAIFWGNIGADVCLSAVHGCGCCLCGLYPWMLTASLRSCGDSCACSLGSWTSLPWASAHYLLWPGGGGAEMLRKTEARRSGLRRIRLGCRAQVFLPRTPAPLRSEGGATAPPG